MPLHVLSQEPVERRWLTLISHRSSLLTVSERSKAAANPSASLAIETSPSSPYGRTTSATGDETIRIPAARNSGVLVGLINRVASLIANGIIPACHPARYAGKSR